MGVSPSKADGFYRRTKDVSSIMKLQCLQATFGTEISFRAPNILKNKEVDLLFLPFEAQ
jgi:hypothetical protein